MIAIEYPYVSFSRSVLVYQDYLIVLSRRAALFIYHGYGVCRAYLRAYSASFAVFEVYSNGDGSTDDSIWAVKPAEKTAGLVLPGRDALLLVYHRSRVAPFTSWASFADAW